MKRPTLTDVARLAGVSVTTASYILNGRTSEMRIAAETEHRVRAAMRELDYRPNVNARNLRRSSTQTIGLVSDFVATGAFASRLLTGATAGARQADHLLVIGETLGDPDVERLMIEEMHDRQVDGIIYATLTASVVAVPERLRGGRTVLLNCVDPHAGLPAVVPDDVAGGRQAAEHLLAAGLTEGVYAVGEDPAPESTAGRDRLSGITSALGGVGVRMAGVVSCPWAVEPAFEAVSALLRTGVRPAALVCLNDRIAMGAYQALAAHGLSVPEDVSVISFDGSDLASWLRPRLTSLGLPFDDMGARAVEVLMDPAWGKTRTVTLPLVLHGGESLRRRSSGPAGAAS